MASRTNGGLWRSGFPNMPEMFAVLADPHSGDPHIAHRPEASYIIVTVISVMILVVLYRSCILLRAGNATRKFQLNYYLALRSACLFLMMVVPLLVPSWKARFAPAFLVQYGWLPFWYVFLLANNKGGFFMLCLEALVGVPLCLFAACIMNYLMPGGAGPLANKASPHFDPELVKYAWLPFGYSDNLALVYVTSVTFFLLVSRLSTDTKRFFLGAFSDLVVTFMNPNQDAQAFVAVVFDWDFNFNLMGPSMSQLWVVFIAIFLSAVTLWPTCNNRTHSALTMASENLAGLALDSGGIKRLLLAYYSHGATHFELESCKQYIDDLRRQNKAVIKLLDNAWWEAWGKQGKVKHRHLRWLSVLMERLHMVLLNLLVQVKTHEEMRGAEKKVVEAMAAPLDLFVAHADILGRLAAPDNVLGGEHLPDHFVEKCIFEAQRCDEALKAGLRALQEVHGKSNTLLLEMAFIDSLREWAALLKRFAQGPPDDEKPSRLWDWLPHHSWLLPGQCQAALRNTTSWLLCLLYSVYTADYNSVCVVCVSFIFSSSLGKLWDRNLNRFLGVSMGVLVGNLPAWLCFAGNNYNRSVHSPADLCSYLMLMFVVWLASTYSYFDSGRWSYAFCLVAGIGGVKLLKPLGDIAGQRETWRRSEYNMLMDTFVACLITFIVDLFYMWLFKLGTRHQVADSMSSVLDAIASVVTDVLEGASVTLEDLRDCTDLQTSALPRRRFHELVLQARENNEEAQRKEATWQLPYKARLAEALLDQFDAISVATYAIRSSAERCDDNRLQALLQSTIPANLTDRVREYARVAKDAFNQKTNQDNFGLAELSQSNTRRSSLMVAAGFQAGLQLLDELNTPPSVGHERARVTSDGSLLVSSFGSDSFEDGACRTLGHVPSSPSVPRQPSNGRAEQQVCSLEEQRFQKVWADISEACAELTLDSVESKAAMLSAMTGVLALRLALERVEVLLRDEEYMCFGHWGYDTSSALEQLRRYCPEKAHFRRSHQRVNLRLPKLMHSISSRRLSAPKTVEPRTAEPLLAGA